MSDDRKRSVTPPRYRDRSRSPQRSEPTENPGTNLFVTGLVPKVKEEELESLFSKYGHVTSINKVEKIQIMRDPHSTDSRGFGFINFNTGAEAEAALALDGVEFMGKILIVQKAKRARARTPTPGQYRGPIKERRDERGPSRYGRYDPYERRDYDRRPPPDRYDRYDRPPPSRYDRFERRDYGYDRYESRGPPRDRDYRAPPPGYDRERRY